LRASSAVILFSGSFSRRLKRRDKSKVEIKTNYNNNNF